MEPENHPIGHWLKLLDTLIEERFVATLERHGLVRRHWQVLNGLRTDSPFWTDEGIAPERVRADLVRLGWTTPDGTLTPEGDRARATILTEVTAVRERAMAGVTPDDYTTTMSTLRRMSANLEGGSPH